MDKKIKIEVSGREGSYSIIPWDSESHPDIPVTRYSSESHKIDKRYLLRANEKVTERKMKIFGIADTIEEADKRTYEKAIEIAKNIEKWYAKRKIETQIINKTEKEKSLESKL